MKYLTKFETSTGFESYTLDENNTPNVSLIKELLGTTGSIVYTPKIQHDYSLDYFTLVAIDDCEFGFTTDCFDEGDGLSYSLDNGTTWSEYYNTTEGNYISVTAGNKILFKGHNFDVSTNGSCNQFPIFYAYYNNIENPSKFNVEGNVMSLLYGDNFRGQTSFNSESEYILSCLFHNASGLINAENLILPATTLTNYCYCYMFSGCTNLTTAPELPAITLTESCYSNMFSGCTSLTTAPELPATILASSCYEEMFSGCTSLTTAPSVLPATTLAGYCYQNMFNGCTSLTVAPELPATTLATYCYNQMFQDCTSLTTAPGLPATTLAESCYDNMFSNTNVLPDCTNIDFSSQSVVASGGLQGLFAGTKITDVQLDTILKEHGINNYSLPVTTLVDNCYQEMFANCTSLTTAPELPATTLEESCYHAMFYNCTSLTTAPELPATTLVGDCYWYMFYGCTSLNSITCLATDISAEDCTSDWVSGVAESGTFTKAPSMTSWTTGNNGVPSGWTVVDA